MAKRSTDSITLLNFTVGLGNCSIESQVWKTMKPYRYLMIGGEIVGIGEWATMKHSHETVQILEVRRESNGTVYVLLRGNERGNERRVIKDSSLAAKSKHHPCITHTPKLSVKHWSIEVSCISCKQRLPRHARPSVPPSQASNALQSAYPTHPPDKVDLDGLDRVRKLFPRYAQAERCEKELTEFASSSEFSSFGTARCAATGFLAAWGESLFPQSEGDWPEDEELIEFFTQYFETFSNEDTVIVQV